MTDISSTFKSIRSIYKALSNKDLDVSLSFRGSEYGQTKSWVARVDSREVAHEEHDGALIKLLAMLKEELTIKTKSAEHEATKLRQFLNQLEN